MHNEKGVSRNMNNKKRHQLRILDMLRTLSDENRLTILELLSENNEMCARDLLSHLRISQPTLSHHMSVLLENHLVEARKTGHWVFYKVSRESMQELQSFIENMIKASARGEEKSNRSDKKAEKIVSESHPLKKIKSEKRNSPEMVADVKTSEEKKKKIGKNKSKKVVKKKKKRK